VLVVRWSEIDFEAHVWTVAAARMKRGREHRVPLSRRALAILERLSSAKTSEWVFPGHKPGAPLSVMALEMVLRRMKVEGVTVHGFRSAFRDWCGEETGFSREVAGAALAHFAGDATEVHTGAGTRLKSGARSWRRGLTISNPARAQMSIDWRARTPATRAKKDGRLEIRRIPASLSIHAFARIELGLPVLRKALAAEQEHRDW
jgi:Phage integrase family